LETLMWPSSFIWYVMTASKIRTKRLEVEKKHTQGDADETKDKDMQIQFHPTKSSRKVPMGGGHVTKQCDEVDDADVNGDARKRFVLDVVDEWLWWPRAAGMEMRELERVLSLR